MPIGQVKWFDIKKGYGFIARPDARRDTFVSYEDIEDYGKNLQEGDQVEFEIANEAKGPRAVKVVVKSKALRRNASLGFNSFNESPKSSHERNRTGGRFSLPDESERGTNGKGLAELNPKRVIRNANYYFSQALVAKTSRDYDKARELFEKAIEHGASVQVFYAYAAMEKEGGRFESARRVFQRGIERFPHVGKLYEDYGMLEKRDGHHKRAEQIFRQGLEHDPGHMMLHRSLAQVLLGLGGPERLRKAEEHFDIARKAHLISDAVSELQYRLVKVLRGHRRGRLTIQFLEQAGFTVSRIHLHPMRTYAVDLIVEPTQIEYAESYDLGGEIFVRCFFKNISSVEDMNQLLSDFKDSVEYGLVNHDVLFIILQSSIRIRDYLYNLLEQPGRNPTVVPIEEAQIQAGLETSGSGSLLKQVLDEWLYRRNLYDERFPVSGRKFFGREHELAGLIRSTDLGSPVGLFGLRKVGKTSLLYKLKEKRPQDNVIYIDLQAVPQGIQECGYLYWEMANQLRIELKHKYPHLEKRVPFTVGGKYRIYEAIPNKETLAAQFDADLRSVKRALGESRETTSVKVVVLLDEVERMLSTAGSQGFKGYADFFAYLRGISQQESFLISIVTGANPAICEEPQWEGRDNPVFKFYQETFLPPLEKHECDEMIQKLGRGMGVNYTLECLHSIYQETGGHPFVTRQLCSRIVKHFRERPLLVDEAKVAQGIQEFLFHDASTFREILDRLERDFPEEKELLLFIADGVNTEAELSSLSKSGVHESLRHLVGYQLVERDGTTYRIKIGLLLKWIRRHWLNRED